MHKIREDTDDRLFLRSTIPVMYALERNELYLETVRVSQKPQWDLLMNAVFDVVSTLTSNRTSLYWLCRNISRLFVQRQALWNQLVKETEQRLRKMDAGYCDILRDKGVLSEQFLSRCLQDSFGTVFSPEVTVRLWDKVIARSNLIEAFVAAECLQSLKDIESFKQSEQVDREKFATFLSQVKKPLVFMTIGEVV
ncbi:unnamed protein product [Soboliphyme baturini]|uniref:RUN domain-containing protein n=1 Tax=Soboliphyme baturini TaxID=241478 RepID=A0A183J471_9BILA|nr:unnamed protein product [Soboliphyme baturini]